MEGDNPAISLFQAVEQNSLQNQEEEEDAEDILQRQQEIQNFLTTALDEYKYDESSVCSGDETQKNSLQAYTEGDQLQMLYEMRCKEVKDLIAERDALKAEMNKERTVNENRKALSDNLLEQCKISMGQLQEILVEKTEKIEDYEKALKALQIEYEEKLKKIDELKTENGILIKERDYLTGQLNQKELDNVTTNRISERELQKQYLERIDVLEQRLKEFQQNCKSLEGDNRDLRFKIQSVIREKDDICQEKENFARDLEQRLDDLKSQNSFLLEELQKTKTDYQKYVEDTRAAKQAFEKIKEQIAPSRLQEIDSTVSNLKRLLQEKDDEISELSRVLHLTRSTSVKDAATNTEKHLHTLNEAFIAVQELKRNFKNSKKEMQNMMVTFAVEVKKINQKSGILLKNLNYVFKNRDGLAKSATDEVKKLKKEKAMLVSTLRNINAYLLEAKEQTKMLENRVAATGQTGEKLRKEVCDKETNTESDVSAEHLLQKEVELRDKIASDFQEKLKKIEEKYRIASQEKFNYKKLKQQMVELAAKLHNYKSLYEESRQGLAEFLTVSNEHIKSLETKILALEKGRIQTQKEMQALKKLLEDRSAKLEQFMLLTSHQEKEITSLRKQVLVEKFKDVATLTEKVDGIAKSADVLVYEVENEFDRRIKVLSDKH